jgi:heptosyltransferase-2
LIKEIKENIGIILVICPNWVGDVVMATPAFECIRQNFPDARVFGLIRSYAKGVVEDGPWFDKIIESNDKTIAGFLDLIRTIRALKPDLTIVLPSSFRSALIARLGGARRICGYRREGRNALLTGGPEPERGANGISPVPMREYYLRLCRWLQLKIPEAPGPHLYFSDALQAKADQLLAKWSINNKDMVIGLNPGAKFGSSKCWPPNYFAELAEILSKRWHCKILLFIGPGEEILGESITASSHAEIINTGPERIDLSLLKPLIKRCQLLISNDTGPRHYAVAFGVPVVVIMGPTDPRYTNSNLEKTVVLRHLIDCSPCHEKTCHRNHECMVEISPQNVLGSAEKLLRKLD